MRAVDAAGNRSATTAVYVPPADGEVDPTNPVLLDAGAAWNYRALNSAAPENWTQASFDDSQWSTGAAPLGYGDSRIATVLTATGSRPVTSYFRSHFQVADANAIKGVTVRYVADDGAVVYINGHEVDRTRMGSGTVSYQTRADYAPSYGTAVDSMSEVFVPAALLRSGATHRGRDARELHAHRDRWHAGVDRFRSGGTPENNDTHEPSLPTTPQNLGDATQPIDVRGMTSGEVIPSGTTQWNYWTAMAAPASDWATTASLADWSRGAGPIGWGDSDAVTRLDIAKKDRPVTYYFARDIDLGTVTPNTTLTVKVRADDGVVLRINGQVVDTKRMSHGNISHDTYANAVVTAPKAASDLLEVKIPASYLTSGVNRIGVEEHINYKGTPSMSFDLSATMAK